MVSDQIQQDHAALEARGIGKSFPGVKALDGVDLTINRGRLTAILGENGAGKSTLMNVLTGVYKPTTGQIFVDGREVVFTNPSEAQQLGIGIVFQELNLFPHLSVAENIFLGNEPLTRFGLVDYRRMNAEAATLLRNMRLEITPQTLVGDLRVGQQQMVEIAKVLSHRPRILIMDEPTSALSENEIETLFTIIEDLKKDGVAIIYITHKFDELDRIGDDFMVLRDGRFISAGRLGDYSRDELIGQMVGRELAEFRRSRAADAANAALVVVNLHLIDANHADRYLLEDVSFEVQRGEILGIFGLIGAGRTELLEALFGVHPKFLTGKVEVDGASVKLSSPAAAVAAGIGLVPEDRRREGLVLPMSVAGNASLASLDRLERYMMLSDRNERQMVAEYVKRLGVKTPSLDQEIRHLSGGNQQKVILAKWMAINPRVLLLDEPTRGIDVNAKREIYELIDELAGTGIGVVLVSSELPEILGLSDRIIVMSGGRQTGHFSRAEATEEVIMRAALPQRESSLAAHQG